MIFWHKLFLYIIDAIYYNFAASKCITSVIFILWKQLNITLLFSGKYFKMQHRMVMKDIDLDSDENKDDLY